MATEWPAIYDIAERGAKTGSNALSAMTGLPLQLQVESIHQAKPFISQTETGLTATSESPQGFLSFQLRWEDATTLCKAILGRAPQAPKDLDDHALAALCDLCQAICLAFSPRYTPSLRDFTLSVDSINSGPKDASTIQLDLKIGGFGRQAALGQLFFTPTPVPLLEAA